MAGAQVIITFDGRAALAAIRNAAALMEAPAVMLADIGEELLVSTRARAAAEVDPAGLPWAPLSPRYARRKAKLRPGLPTLKFDNHLLGDRLVYQVNGPELAVGTSGPYAAAQQFGRPEANLPARPFLGLSEEDNAAVLRITAKHLLDAIRGSTAQNAL